MTTSTTPVILLVSRPSQRNALITRFYYRFLDEGNVADFVRNASSHYTVATLQRLATQGDCFARRSAVLALTLLGNSESVTCVGESLRDTDRVVRVIAEDGLQEMWSRVGSSEENQQLQLVMRCNAAGQFAEAIQLADRLLERRVVYGEAWHQRGIACAADGELLTAITDHQRALECEPYHFPAALCTAQCYLELGDLLAAINALQWALQIHPYCDFARAQMRRLQRHLREQTDR